MENVVGNQDEQLTGAFNETQTPLFVISSGRTGSTFLARLIRSHPQLLCASDIFEPVGKVPYLDRQKWVNGETFWSYLSAPSFKQRIAFWRARPTATSELLFLPEDDELVSLLLSYTIPFISEDPMATFKELEKEVSAFPERTMADQFIAFLDLLRDRSGKTLWVERTGGSLPHTREIIETWPHGKFVHNFRNPREVALSMMTGSFFRLYLELEKNPHLDKWDWDYMPPIQEMGAMLNAHVVRAVEAFKAVPAEQKHDLRYEDLLANTRETLLGLTRFFFEREPTDVDVTWAEEQASRVRPAKPKFPEIDSEKQAQLEHACRHAIDLLGY